MTSQDKPTKEYGIPDRVDSLGKVDSGKDCPRARLGFVKLIQNGLKKIKILIENAATKTKTGWRGDKVDLDSSEKCRQDRMMRSNTFEVKEFIKLGRNEASESRGFSPSAWH